MSEDWNQYQKLVLSELERLSDASDQANRSLLKIMVQLESVKTRTRIYSSLFGTLGGVVVVVLLDVLRSYLQGR